MINEADFLDACGAVCGHRASVPAEDFSSAVRAVLGRLGFIFSGDVVSREGVLKNDHSQLFLVSPGPDGYLFLPILPGSKIEILDGQVWRQGSVVSAAPGAYCRQIIKGIPDDTPVFGAYARVLLELAAAPVPPRIEAAKNLKRQE